MQSVIPIFSFVIDLALSNNYYGWKLIEIYSCECITFIINNMLHTWKVVSWISKSWQNDSPLHWKKRFYFIWSWRVFTSNENTFICFDSCPRQKCHFPNSSKHHFVAKLVVATLWIFIIKASIHIDLNIRVKYVGICAHVVLRLNFIFEYILTP